MAVAFDAKSTADTNTNAGTSITHNNMTVGSGSNRLLLVVISNDNNAALTSLAMTWDSGGTNQALSLVSGATATNTTSGHSSNCQIWGVLNPTSGNKTLSVTWTGTHECAVSCVSFTGVDQTSLAVACPHGTGATGNTTTNSVTVTSATGNMVVASHATSATSSISSVSGTSIYIDNTGTNLNKAANRDNGAATVTLTATAGATGQWSSAGCDILAAAAAITIGWFQPPDTLNYGKPFKTFLDGPAFIAPIAPISSNAAFQGATLPVYGNQLRDFVPPAFTLPKAVTVGISGMAWFEPLDIPVYGKSLRDFVAPAFTEPNAVTVGISGMSWFEPLDIPVYGKPLRDFIAPAFTEPVAVTVGISGMAWYEPYDQPFYGKKLRDDTSSAFTAPVTPAVGISGNAWFEPWDIPVYGKPLRDFLTPSFTSQFVIAGISGNAWFVREDVYKRKPPPFDEAPARAIQFASQTVGISGIAWYHPLDFAKGKVVNYTYPPTYTPFDQIINWGYITSDSLVLPDKMFPNAPSWDPRFISQAAPVGISGMSWFEPWDIPVYGKPLRDFVAAAYSLPVQKTLIGSFNVSDTIFLPDPPISLPIALEQPIVQVAPAGISGISWFEPWDIPFYGRKGKTEWPVAVQPPPPTINASFNVSDTIFLPDAPLSPSFAWDPRAFVPISGMSWFEPPDFAKGKVVTYTPPPAHLDVQIYAQATIGFSVSDTIFLPDPPLFIPPDYFLPTPTIFWALTSDDTVILPDPLLTIPPSWDPKFTFQQTVGISGMAWFEPPDFAKGLVVNYTPPAAWDPQFVFQIPSAGYEHIVKFIGNVGHFMIR